MKNLPRTPALLVFALLALAPIRAFAVDVQIYLPNLEKVSATNPLPVTGAFTFTPTAPTGTTPVTQVGVVYTQSDVSVTTASTAVIGLDATRTYLLIQNKGPENVYIAFGVPAVVGTGVIIGAGGNYEALQAPTNAVNAIAPTGTAALAVIRGN